MAVGPAEVTQSARPSLAAAVSSSGALLLGFGMLMLGDGLQGTLLSVRATLEGFPTAITGLIMSAFYAGFLGGSVYSPRIIQRVGHIRVFAALASLASAGILLHAVFVVAATWGLLRFLTGFCLAGIYVVCESWLNERATNETRGQLLSVYMVVTYAGVGLGQLLLNLADPLGYELFVLVSMLISLALVPLLLSAGSAPSVEEPTPVSMREIYRVSPLGVVGVVGIGMTGAALFAMGPVYAENVGLSIREISWFMGAAVLGCVMLQWPIGHLSDLWDRRVVLTVVTFAASVAAIAMVSTKAVSVPGLLFIAGLFGGLSLPIYSICIAHANDHLEPEQMVAASGGLVLFSGLGSILGPSLASLSMTLIGPDGLFWTLAFVHAAIGLFAVYRMAARRARPLAEQGHYVPTTLRYSLQFGYRPAKRKLEGQDSEQSDPAEAGS